MSTSDTQYGLFSVFGVEIEFMIVQKNSLDILALADKIIADLSGSITNEMSLGDIAISNELALHVIELKTNGPVKQLQGLENQFHQAVQKINHVLASYDALLMPTGAHPWFQPTKQTQLWPHGDQAIYKAFDKIFHCEGHGWTNLQSVHINLPFKDDHEFSILHNAVRLILPFIPAITASTPYLNGRNQHCLDTRLQVYANNQKIIPSITGNVIPEFIQSQQEYDQRILQPMYRDIQPYDPDRLLQYEWLNSRGAIARFDRNAIEIRVVDTQECPKMDLALVSLITCAIHFITEHATTYLNNPFDHTQLRQQYDACLTGGLQSPIVSQALLKQLGMEDTSIRTVKQVWQYFCDKAWIQFDERTRQGLELILEQGNLAERILIATQRSDDLNKLHQVYQELTTCLRLNQEFCP